MELQSSCAGRMRQMGHLRKWLKCQQYLPKQLQIPHSTSARARIYYLGHGTRPCEPADTEEWEQGWGASIAELAWGAEWCQPWAAWAWLNEGPQGAPVPLLHPFQPCYWKEMDCHLQSVEESVWAYECLQGFFFPKTRKILVLRSGSALRSHGEKEHDHPMVLNSIEAQVFWKRFLSCQGWRTSTDSLALFKT